MAENVEEIAARLGAEVVSRLPDAGGGSFGAARLARLVEMLRTRLVPGRGLRAGRPTDPEWVRHPKVPMSEATQQRLVRLAERASSPGRKISPMQLAARILEDALDAISENERTTKA